MLLAHFRIQSFKLTLAFSLALAPPFARGLLDCSVLVRSAAQVHQFGSGWGVLVMYRAPRAFC
eukprot:5530457-Alexandrium_andersonii.AAC.1